MFRYIALFLLSSSIVLSEIIIKTVGYINNHDYAIYDNDVVFLDEHIKFMVLSDLDTKLDIEYIFENKINKLSTINLERNKIVSFPNDKSGLKFDNEGDVVFLFKQNNHTVKQFTIKYKSSMNQMVDKQNKETTQDTMLSNYSYGINPLNIISNQRGDKEKEAYKSMIKSTVVIESSSGELGSGVVISKNGEILTNYHVVKNSSYVNVAFKPKSKHKSIPSKNSFLKASIIKVDTKRDLAIVKILDKQTLRDIIPIKLSNLDDIDIGDDIFTLGHPQGELFTLGTGIVSQVRDNYTWTNHKVNFIIQTQSSISSGNSGGPLVNTSYDLIGINTFSKTKGQNLNYAVSINDIKEFVSKKDTLKFEIKSNNKNKAYEVLNIKNGFDTKKIPISTVSLDSNKNKVVDLVAIDVGRNGVYNYLLFDSNEDGKFDKRAYDKDGDGIVERTMVY